MLESLPWLAALTIVCALAAFWRYRSGVEHVEKLRHEHLRDDAEIQRHLADAKVDEVRVQANAALKAAETQERLAEIECRRIAAEQKLIETRNAAAEKELVREEKRATLAAKKVKSC